jgi:uncharacterized protein YjbI with pentapeptide repeats
MGVIKPQNPSLPHPREQTIPSHLSRELPCYPNRNQQPETHPMKAMPIAIWEMLDDLFGLIERRWRIVVSLGVLLGGLAYLNSVVSLGEVFSFKTWGIPEQDDRATLSEVVRNLGLLAIGVVGLVFGIWRAWTAHLQTISAQDQATTAIRQAEIAEQGHITDRFNKAVEQLGSPEQTIRIGGIYALWRIANDSPDRDQRPIWNILCAFVRQPSYPHIAQISEEDNEINNMLRDDVQTILNLMGSEEAATSRANKAYEMDLTGAELSKGILNRGNFSGGNFTRANLSGSTLINANLSRTLLTEANFSDTKMAAAILIEAFGVKVDFSDSDISFADISNAQFVRANFKSTDLAETNFFQAQMNSSDFSDANMYGSNLTNSDFFRVNFAETDLFNANLSNTNLAKARNLTQEQIDETFVTTDEKPILSKDLVWDD